MTIRNRHILTMLILAHLLMGSAVALLMPHWGGHESDYYNVVRLIVSERRLPTAADYPAGDMEIRQASQPPLYFLLAAPIVALFDDGAQIPLGLHPLPFCPGGAGAESLVTPYITDRSYNAPLGGSNSAALLLRLLNVVFGALSVLLVYNASTVMFPGRPAVALIGAAILAFEPVTLQFIPIVSSDALLLLVCAALLWIWARLITMAQPTRLDLVLLIALSFAAPLIKLPGWVALGISILVLIDRALFNRRLRRAFWVGLGVIALITTGIMFFNFSQYGSALGRYSIFTERLASLSSTLTISPVVLTGVFRQTWVELLDPLVTLRARAALFTVYQALLIGSFVGAALGIGWMLITRRRQSVRVCLLLIGVIAATLVMVILRNTINATADNTTLDSTAMIFTPLRYYVTMLPAVAVIVAAGLGELFTRRSRGWLGGALALAFGVVSLATVANLWVSRPTVTTLTQSAFDSLSGVERVAPEGASDAPHIVGYRLSENPQAGWTDVALYMTVPAGTPTNYLGSAQIVGAEGVLSTCEFLPVQGAYPTPRWTPGEIVVHDLRFPNCAGAQASGSALSVRWIAQSNSGLATGESASIMLASLGEMPIDAASCPANLGVIGGAFQLLQMNAAATWQTGQLHIPSFNWLVLKPLAVPVRRVVELRHTSSDARYTCIGSPSEGAIPIAGWQRGQTIYFDGCALDVPADAPPGTYRVVVGMQTADGSWLPTAAGTRADGDDWLFAGEVVLQNP